MIKAKGDEGGIMSGKERKKKEIKLKAVRGLNPPPPHSVLSLH